MYTATTEIYTYVHTLSLRDALPYSRVKVVSDRDWIVTLDVSADEYYSSEQVKRALVRYPIKVVRLDIDPEHNPFGPALDRSEEHKSELQSLMRNSYAVFCLKKQTTYKQQCHT